MRSYLFALAFSCAVIFVLTALFDIEPLASVVLAAINVRGLCNRPMAVSRPAQAMSVYPT
jgi:hypothetical protein